MAGAFQLNAFESDAFQVDATAFQADAFQVNAFQIDAAPVPVVVASMPAPLSGRVFYLRNMRKRAPRW